MTKKQQCDCTITPKTAIQESQKSGFWKKLFGTWSVIGGSLQRLFLHLRLWMWAATKTKNFHCFEIGFTKIIHITANYYPSSFEFLLITISFSRPMFYLFEPGHIIGDFCREHGFNYEVFEDDIPF
ncbi:hypothetical protein Riv7116_1863 [Rivularia sp. PCC 7116]|uniref:hypothetical protein n=1 Tax=Rivularia sp. PCC 7116 TaxID=373994 RepID=UPI00029EF4FC|nr:hypothetical protein [Rivularia sp. PCC 7116]AFY54404.1 hypothetical protein Riv7116_1863 [Rivularia sp. PCC 7116]